MLFRIDDLDLDVPVFTTRPDTLFGATFFVLAPESPLIDRLVEGTRPRRGGAGLRLVAGARTTVERDAQEPASSPAAM